MKKLTHYAVKVTDTRQMKLALKFYRLASKRPLIQDEKDYWFEGSSRLIGLGTWVDNGLRQRHVTMGNRPYLHEKVIPFSQIKTLADTPSRKRAYKKVFGK